MKFFYRVSLWLMVAFAVNVQADPAQTGQWTKIWGEPHAASTGFGGNDDEANDITYDGQGNLYLTGCHDSVEFGSIWSRQIACNFFISKMDTDGNVLWYNVLDAGWDKDDEGFKIEMDSVGNVIVSGTTNGKDLSGQIDVFESTNFLAKYDPAGNQIWLTYFGNVTDVATQFVLDEMDNIYVAGYSTENDPDRSDSVFYRDSVLYEFDSNGNQTSRTVYESATHDDGLVAYDGTTGRLYMVVSTHDINSRYGMDRAISLRLLNEDRGIWIQRDFATRATDLKAHAIEMDPAGLTIAGSGPATLFDPDYDRNQVRPYFVTRLNLHGAYFGDTVWVDQFMVCAGCMKFNDIHIDDYRRIHITGVYGKNQNSNITGGKHVTGWGNDILYLMYNVYGDRITVDQMGSYGTLDWGGGVTTDEDGNTFIAGGTHGPMNGVDAPGVNSLSSDIVVTRNEP